MANSENFYNGANYGFDPAYGKKENYGDTFLGNDYRTPASHFGPPSDARSANQLKAVSDKLSTGAKTIEVSGVFPQVLDSIPNEQFKEINRLKKLAGVDLTFHGPLVEPTGLNPQGQRWEEGDRLQVERQLINAVNRSHALDPNGNVVVTVHSSNGLPEPETKIINEDGKEVLKDFYIVDTHSGGFGKLPLQTGHLKQEEIATDPKAFLERRNKEAWYDSLQGINFEINRGAQQVDQLLRRREGETEEDAKKRRSILELQKHQGTPEGQRLIKDLEKWGINKDYINEQLDAATYAEISLRDAYQKFQGLYDQAYSATEESGKKEDLQMLKNFREEIKPKLASIDQPGNIGILADELRRGIQMLRIIDTPKLYKPMREWAISKAGETFGNVAFNSFKKYKNSSPIISIENPPAGSGLSTADDLRDLVKEARRRFILKAQKEMNLSEGQAKLQADKLIGVTWDVGHINMLRGKGYGEKHLIEETKKIAPLTKHIHLSDNFGIEHTELPMGMGNVPTKKMLAILDKYNKQAKKIVETGNWYEHFKVSPMKKTFEAFGSPLYSMQMSPYWNQVGDLPGNYFAGQGTISPEVHHSMFGAGFANLPVELGGQMAGRSRVSGNPME